jgi:hypothetical protein
LRIAKHINIEQFKALQKIGALQKPQQPAAGCEKKASCRNGSTPAPAHSRNVKE